MSMLNTESYQTPNSANRIRGVIRHALDKARGDVGRALSALIGESEDDPALGATALSRGLREMVMDEIKARQTAQALTIEKRYAHPGRENRKTSGVSANGNAQRINANQAPHGIPVAQNKPRVSLGIAAGVARSLKLSILDTFRLNGVPIGDCTGEEIATWADNNDKQSRIARAIGQGVPPTMKARDVLTADEAERRARIVTGKIYGA